MLKDIQAFLSVGGEDAAKELVELLADSFQGTVQMSNLMLEWLVILGGGCSLRAYDES